MSRIKTVWDLRSYDVWGNAIDGYDVNNSFNAGTVELTIRTTRYNPGTLQEFTGASPSDYQIKKVFGVGCRIDTDGDDTTIYVTRASDSYPIGEMHCMSHESLSPVRTANGK